MKNNKEKEGTTKKEQKKWSKDGKQDEEMSVKIDEKNENERTIIGDKRGVMKMG